VKLRRCITAVARRAVKRLAAIATARAAEASPRAGPSFRPLTESEAEAIVGAELLAQVAAGAGRP
jgi:hypothetical protein